MLGLLFEEINEGFSFTFYYFAEHILELKEEGDLTTLP
jgi:hypothetical protein